MPRLGQLSIKQKLQGIIMLTVATALAVACGALLADEAVTVRGGDEEPAAVARGNDCG